MLPVTGQLNENTTIVIVCINNELDIMIKAVKAAEKVTFVFEPVCPLIRPQSNLDKSV